MTATLGAPYSSSHLHYNIQIVAAYYNIAMFIHFSVHTHDRSNNSFQLLRDIRDI
jgi:hypothetical protein